MSIEDLVPTSIAVVTLAQDPADFFATERPKDQEERTDVLCLDARSSSFAEIVAWGNRFMALMQEEDLIEPMLVVVTTPVPNTVDLASWLKVHEKSQLDVVETSDLTTTPAEIYQNEVRKDLTALCSTPPADGLDMEDDADARPVEDFMPQDEREEWEQQLRELEEQ